MYFLLLAVASAWKPLSPMPNPRSLHAFVSGCEPGTFFAIGGLRNGEDPDPWDRVDVYTAKNDSWHTLDSTLADGRFSFAAASLGARDVYVFGGLTNGGAVFDVADSVEFFSCDNQIWATYGKLPKPLAGASAVSAPAGLQAGIVIAGGWFEYGDVSSEVLHFNGTVFLSLPPLLTGRGSASLVWVGPSLFFISGTATWDGPPVAVAESCDWNSGCRWKNVSSPNTPRSLLAGAVVGPVVFAVGGLDSQQHGLSSVETLNTSSGTTWNKGPFLPTPRIGSAVAVLNNNLFLCGGSNDVAGKFDVSLISLAV